MRPRHLRVVITFACPPDRCRPVILALAALTVAVAAAMAMAMAMAMAATSGRIA